MHVLVTFLVSAFTDKYCDKRVYVCRGEKDVSDLCKHGAAARQHHSSYALIRHSPSVHSFTV